MITDNFDDLFLDAPAIYCTYCWTIHYGNAPCGPDKWRYLSSSADYQAYTRQYLANQGQHMPLGTVTKQLRLL